jgi:hypothetical protein
MNDKLTIIVLRAVIGTMETPSFLTADPRGHVRSARRNREMMSEPLANLGARTITVPITGTHMTTAHAVIPMGTD